MSVTKKTKKLGELFRQDTRFFIAVVHRALDVTILASVVKSIGQFEGQHIAIVATVLCDFFLNITAYNLGLVRQRLLAERMLGIERN